MRKVRDYVSAGLALTGMLLITFSFPARMFSPEVPSWLSWVFERAKPGFVFFLSGTGLIAIGCYLSPTLLGAKPFSSRSGPLPRPGRVADILCGKCEALNDCQARFCGQCGAALCRHQPAIGTRASQDIQAEPGAAADGGGR